MAKKQTHYVCQECGADYAKWMGQCLQCHAWNSIVEFREARLPPAASAAAQRGGRSGYAGTISQLQRLDDIQIEDQARVPSGSSELDRVLGGGFVPGSVILLGGSPGAGKSTLLLQTAARLAGDHSVLYVTGEESVQQIALRARRLKLPTDSLQVMSQTDVDEIARTIEAEGPRIAIIDSIQVMSQQDLSSAPGSVAQVRECAAVLTRLAKSSGTILILVGHVTKDGSLAGPKVLEHIIDASILLESSDDSRYRTLRANKNRFGAVNELGVFAMLDAGLKDVKNPSALFLSREEEPASGSIVTPVWEGSRPLLVELQVLVDDSGSGAARRLALGYDVQRLSLLLAVLSRHGGLSLADQDVFLNVVGGIRILETAADLAVLAGLVSSYRNRPVPVQTAIFGEIGLSGEIRPVVSGEERALEAAKHGFIRIILPKANMPRRSPEGVECVPVRKVAELLELI